MAIDWDALVLAPCMGALRTEPDDAPAQVSWNGGAWFPIPDAVFDRTHVEIAPGDGRAPISGFMPTLGIRQAALPEGVTMRQGDRVLVRDDLLMVVDVQADGAGHVLLILATP